MRTHTYPRELVFSWLDGIRADTNDKISVCGAHKLAVKKYSTTIALSRFQVYVKLYCKVSYLIVRGSTCSTQAAHKLVFAQLATGLLAVDLLKHCCRLASACRLQLLLLCVLPSGGTRR